MTMQQQQQHHHPPNVSSLVSFSVDDPVLFLESADHVVVAIPLSVGRRCHAVITKHLHSDLSPHGTALFTSITGESLIRCLSYVIHEWKEIERRKEKLAILMKQRGQKSSDRSNEGMEKEGGGRRGKDRERTLLSSIVHCHHLLSDHCKQEKDSQLQLPLSIGVDPPTTPLSVLLAPSVSLSAVSNHLLCELASSSYFLEIPPLVDLTCQRLADSIQGKSPEEIRNTFNITNDFTPTEEIQVKQRVMERTLLYPTALLESYSSIPPEYDPTQGLVAGFNAGMEGAIAAREKLKLKLLQKRALEMKEEKKEDAISVAALSPTITAATINAAKKKKKKKKTKKKEGGADDEKNGGTAADEEEEEEEGQSNKPSTNGNNGADTPTSPLQLLKRMASSLTSQVSSSLSPISFPGPVGSTELYAARLPYMAAIAAATATASSGSSANSSNSSNSRQLTVPLPLTVARSQPSATPPAPSPALATIPHNAVNGAAAGPPSVPVLTASILSSAGPPLPPAFPHRFIPKQEWLTLRLIFVTPVSPYGVHLLHLYLPSAVCIYTGLTLSPPGSSPRSFTWRADPVCSPLVHLCYVNESQVIESVSSASFRDYVFPLLRCSPSVIVDMWDMWRTGRFMRCCSHCGMEGHLPNDDTCAIKTITDSPADSESKHTVIAKDPARKSYMQLNASSSLSLPSSPSVHVVTLRFLFRLCLVSSVVQPLKALLPHALFLHLGFHPLYTTPTHMLHVTFRDKESLRACMLQDVPSLLHLMHTPPRIELFDVTKVLNVLKACDQCGSEEHTSKACPIVQENPTSTIMDVTMLPPTSFAKLTTEHTQQRQQHPTNTADAASTLHPGLANLSQPSPSPLSSSYGPPRHSGSGNDEYHTLNNGTSPLLHATSLQEPSVLPAVVNPIPVDEDDDSSESSQHLNDLIDAKLSGLQLWEQHQQQSSDLEGKHFDSNEDEDDEVSDSASIPSTDSSLELGLKSIKAHQKQLPSLYIHSTPTSPTQMQMRDEQRQTNLEQDTADTSTDTNQSQKESEGEGRDSSNPGSTRLLTYNSEAGTTHDKDWTEIPGSSSAPSSESTTPLPTASHASVYVSASSTAVCVPVVPVASVSPVVPSSSLCAGCVRHSEMEKKLLRLLDESSKRLALLEERVKKVEKAEERSKKVERLAEKIGLVERIEERIKALDKELVAKKENEKKVEKRLQEESKKRQELEQWLEDDRRERQEASDRQEQQIVAEKKERDREKQEEEERREKQEKQVKRLQQRQGEWEKEQQKVQAAYREKLEREREREAESYRVALSALATQVQQLQVARDQDHRYQLEQNSTVLNQQQLHSDVLLRVDGKLLSLEQMIVGSAGQSGLLTSRRRLMELIGFDFGKE